jgi:hypothetical protein
MEMDYQVRGRLLPLLNQIACAFEAERLLEIKDRVHGPAATLPHVHDRERLRDPASGSQLEPHAPPPRTA